MAVSLDNIVAQRSTVAGYLCLHFRIVVEEVVDFGIN